MRRGESIRISNLSRISFEKEKKKLFGLGSSSSFFYSAGWRRRQPPGSSFRVPFCRLFFLNSQKLLLLFYFLFFELLDNIKYKKMFKLWPSISHCPKPPLYPRHGGGGTRSFWRIFFFLNAHRVLQSLGDFEST